MALEFGDSIIFGKAPLSDYANNDICKIVS